MSKNLVSWKYSPCQKHGLLGREGVAEHEAVELRKGFEYHAEELGPFPEAQEELIKDLKHKNNMVRF